MTDVQPPSPANRRGPRKRRRHQWKDDPDRSLESNSRSNNGTAPERRSTNVARSGTPARAVQEAKDAAWSPGGEAGRRGSRKRNWSPRGPQDDGDGDDDDMSRASDGQDDEELGGDSDTEMDYLDEGEDGSDLSETSASSKREDREGQKDREGREDRGREGDTPVLGAPTVKEPDDPVRTRPPLLHQHQPLRVAASLARATWAVPLVAGSLLAGLVLLKLVDRRRDDYDDDTLHMVVLTFLTDFSRAAFSYLSPT
ncbi:hypothetical protein M427DRAFT_160201 [Gonapodya prolifera JEL478]|uniref:Uncharacterized protein n=1 Tax=Gonapodya prolifera (strain JEL478) TaxID=1344416 RepID=A0A138ZZT3_GONPJ|nr:hypothetical protein M427DRAFT_160201 [Gonapodya prolifera JEL478]|eukprot:KXS09785.1 hypothetical protein M427DRAFT_160201 [Gonapodya prolifera JEL478]